MKAFAAAALATVAAASAAPEAEPWLVAPFPINPHATTGELVTLPNGAQVPDTTASVKAAAADHLHAKAATYAVHGYGLPLAGLWKREADAEAEPWLGLGAAVPYGPLGAWGSGIKNAPCVNAWNVPVPCGGKKKREAEAEPWLGSVGYTLGHYALGSPINLGGLVHHPNGAVTPPYTPAQQAIAAEHLAIKFGKRSAEAEPWLGYGAPWAYGYAPSTGSPVAGLVAHPNGAVTPPHTPAVLAATADHLATKFGKRSAEAEPWLGYKSAPCVNAWNVPVPC